MTTTALPTLALLQGLNLCIGGASYLMIASAIGVWNAGGWKELEVGLTMFVTNLTYALSVGTGGRLADGWGRPRIAIVGAALCVVAGLVGCIPHPCGAAVCTVLAFLGCACFFPGNAGLFSDAQDPSAAIAVPLHEKVGRYNVGWSLGNVVGFALAYLLAPLPRTAGFLVGALLALVPVIALARWWSLPPRPPAPAGDRAPHPALPLLTRMGRVSLLIWAFIGMTVISLLETTLGRAALPDAHGLATAGLAAYAVGYVAMFAVLGRWGGWVLRPGRLLAIQGCLPLAALCYGLVGILPALPTLVLGGLLLGFAFAAVYTSSIYYSVRLPEGAGRAASLHETFLGIGSTIGPLVGMAVLATWAAQEWPAMAGLSVHLLLVGMVLFVWQVSQWPAIRRAGP